MKCYNCGKDSTRNVVVEYDGGSPNEHNNTGTHTERWCSLCIHKIGMAYLLKEMKRGQVE